MDSQPQNPDFKNNAENIHPCCFTFSVDPDEMVFTCSWMHVT